MGKRLKDLEPTVKRVLEYSIESRKDDFILVLNVYRELQPSISNLSFTSVMAEHKALKLPSIASVTRCRRKIFENNPDLRDTRTTDIRVDEQERYIDYALNLV